MTEMDFSRYAGQLRPLTWRDMDLVAELERALIAELDRALLREERSTLMALVCPGCKQTPTGCRFLELCTTHRPSRAPRSTSGGGGSSG